MATSRSTILPKDTSVEMVPAEFEAALKAAGATVRRSNTFVDPRKLYVMPDFNMRVKSKAYWAHVDELAGLIEANGWDKTKPITVIAVMIDGKPTLVVEDGHHRFEAVNKLGNLSEITINYDEDAATDAISRNYALGTKNTGQPPSPIEYAALAKRQVGLGESKHNIAKKLGKTVRYIDDLLVLAEAPEAYRKAIAEDRISATLAIEKLRLYTPEDAVSVFKAAQAAAKEAGSTKVTAKHFETAATPKVERVAKTRVSAKQRAKAVEDAKTAKKAAAKKKAGAQKIKTSRGAKNSISLFTALFDAEFEKNPKANYTFNYDSQYGHHVALMKQKGRGTLAEGWGETIEIACSEAVKNYNDQQTADL